MTIVRRTGSALALLLMLAAGVPATAAAEVDDGVTPDRVVPPTGSAALVPGAEEAAELAARWRAQAPRTDRRARADDPYELANGCYAVRVRDHGYLERVGGQLTVTGTDRAAAEPFHLEPTALGRYLLWGSEQDVYGAPLGALGDLVRELDRGTVGGAVNGLSGGSAQDLTGALAAGPLGEATGRAAQVSSVAEPSELTDWTVADAGRGVFTLALDAVDAALVVDGSGVGQLGPSEQAARVAFERTTGCAPFPDVEVNVDGPVATGATPYGEVAGYLDAHLHGQAFEFLGGRARCGRPWHPYGVTFALVGCPEHEDTGGRTHVLEAFLSGRDPVAGHDTTGWPTFAAWPEHFSLTYEQTYHRWLERAWRGGLRMYVNLLVDNNVLCEIYPFKHNSCNEMDAVRLQAQRLREFEAYIDAQHGGPGRGWLRIVTDPFEARRVMNEGKLAVVMGIEVSLLFDCTTTLGQPDCDRDQIDRQLDEVYDLGVRQMELVNKFDNALSGVAGDAGTTGALVNSANFLETGSFWRMETCPDEADHAHDRTFPNVSDEADLPDELTARDALAGVVLNAVGSSGLAPAYPAGPHCNQLGLSDLGTYTIERMVERGMLFDPDHMSAVARDQAMTVVEELGYSGVVSSHSWSDAGIYERIQKLGGVVTPMAGSSQGFVEEWRRQRSFADDRFPFGIGFGSDINGFATQGAPRGADAPDPVTYPFRGFGGAIVDRQVSGERVFDINTDGVAHYGLYPDWVEDLRKLAGEDIVRDLERGPEAYLQTWERAIGIAPDACRSDVPELTEAQVAAIERGQTPEQVLLTVGQPRERVGDRFTYCADRGRTVTVTFDADGTVATVARRGAGGGNAGVDRVTGGDGSTAADGAAGRDGRGRAAAVTASAPASSSRHGDHLHLATGALAGVEAGSTRSGPLAVAVLVLGLTLVAIARCSTGGAVDTIRRRR